MYYNRCMRYVFLFLIQFTWGILQNILGLFLFVFLNLIRKRKVFFYHGALVMRWDILSSMGLGMFIFMGHNCQDERILVHEYGHTIQSIILGPLFLFVIGIPSFIWASRPMSHYRRKKHLRYFEFYPERWASNLGERVLHKESAHY